MGSHRRNRVLAARSASSRSTRLRIELCSHLLSCARHGVTRDARSKEGLLLAPCWASGAEPPMVVRVVTGIARTGSVRSVWERSA